MSDSRLIRKCRRKLHITFKDENTDRLLETLIENGEQEIRELTGLGNREFDFADPSPERELLFNYVFYAYNDASDDFEENYAAQISRARMRWERLDYVEEQKNAN